MGKSSFSSESLNTWKALNLVWIKAVRRNWDETWTCNPVKEVRKTENLNEWDSLTWESLL